MYSYPSAALEMMFRMNFLLCFVIALLRTASVAHAWNIVYYTESSCRGDIVAHHNAADSDVLKCQHPLNHITGAKRVLPTVRSARISGLYKDEDGPLDRDGLSSYMVRVYSNTDCFTNCTHRYVIGDVNWDDCVTWPSERRARFDNSPQSQQPVPVDQISLSVVQVGRTASVDGRCTGNSGAALSDGFCLFSHGDRLVVRGREYRMQQVAKGWFHEIPAEQWDDAVHLEGNEVRFAQHGDVDMFGHVKFWQPSPDYLEEVLIEQWDDNKHVEVTRAIESENNIKWGLQQVCDAVEELKIGLSDVTLLSKMPSFDVTRVCAEFGRTRPPKLMDSKSPFVVQAEEEAMAW